MFIVNPSSQHSSTEVLCKLRAGEHRETDENSDSINPFNKRVYSFGRLPAAGDSRHGNGSHVAFPQHELPPSKGTSHMSSRHRHLWLRANVDDRQHPEPPRQHPTGAPLEARTPTPGPPPELLPRLLEPGWVAARPTLRVLATGRCRRHQAKSKTPPHLSSEGTRKRRAGQFHSNPRSRERITNS